MPFTMTESDIDVDNPRPAGEAFTVAYSAECVAPGVDTPSAESPHEDRVQIWGSDGAVVVDTMVAVGAVDVGDRYQASVEVPPLEPGHYDIAVTLPEGSQGAGNTIIVEGATGGGDAGGGGSGSTIDETQEPTLRHGDDSKDGWVEYLREMLATWQEANGTERIAAGSEFDDETHAAVIWFQQGRQLLVDGVVGNQTWAALRTEDPQPIGTDGRAPGTFVEAGREARWYRDDNSASFDADTGYVYLVGFNTGSEPIDATSFEATVYATGADGERREIQDAAFVGPDAAAVSESGETMFLAFRADQLEGDELAIWAQMGDALGGDIMETTVSLEGRSGSGGGGDEGGDDVTTPRVHFVDGSEIGFTPLPRVGEDVEVWWTEVNDGLTHDGVYITEIRWVDHDDQPVGDSEFLEFEFAALETGQSEYRTVTLPPPREDRQGHTIEVYLDRTTYGDGDGNYSEGFNKSYHNVNPTD